MKRNKKTSFIRIFSIIALISMLSTVSAEAKINLGKVVSGAKKVASAYTLSDNDVVAYVHEYIVYSDSVNKIAPAGSDYAVRLIKLTDGLTQVDGMPLNFKVYLTDDVNAFACADGSVRVYSGLMDLMNDDEVLGVIGHEIGHVAHKDTKNALKQSLINSAIFDGIGSTSEIAGKLTDSQLGQIGQSILNSKYSRSQESNADDYGYDFLKSNGKNPWVMAMAFEKLNQLEASSGASSSKLQKMFSSHPSTPDRIKHIIEKCNKDNIEKPEDCDL
ncbi:MAG: M48 family metallopeptidase [Muribaculaceae bacterium]|nr:M48 family metallopeptidase [Muribaculaceae bacterium]